MTKGGDTVISSASAISDSEYCTVLSDQCEAVTETFASCDCKSVNASMVLSKTFKNPTVPVSSSQ